MNYELVNNVFKKHLDLMKNKLNLNEASNKDDIHYIRNMGIGTKLNIHTYEENIWEEIVDIKRVNPAYSLNDCLRESATFLDLMNDMMGIHVNVDQIDYTNCPDVAGKYLNKKEKEKYNKLINILSTRWINLYKTNSNIGLC